MLPEINVFGLAVPTYGLMAVLGALLAILFIWFRSPKLGLKRDDAVYVMVMGGIGAIIGAKLMYIITVLPDFIRDLPLIGTDFAEFARLYILGGMVFYGGLLGGIFAAWLTARSYKIDLRRFYPAVVPALALFCGIGRIGCLMAGCCYGVETTSPLFIEFTHSALAPNGVHLVPTQIIEAVFDFLLFGFMIWYTKDEKRNSSALKLYLILYSVFRFVLEFFRGDPIRGLWFGLSTSQWVSLAVIVGVVIIWLVQIKKGTTQPQPLETEGAPAESGSDSGETGENASASPKEKDDAASADGGKN